MKHAKRVALAILVGFLLAAPAAARPGGPPGGSGPPLDRALEQVDLADEVRERVDVLLDASRRVRRAAQRDLQKAHAEMRDLLEADEPSEERILAKADEIGRLQTDLEKDRLLTLLRIRAELTPDQRRAMTSALRPPHGGPRDGRPPRGPGPPRR